MKTRTSAEFLALVVLALALSLPPRAQAAPAGNALRFVNGSNSHVRISGFGNRAPTNEITIEFWQLATFAQQQSTLSLTPDTGTNRINVHVPFADGVVYWDFGDSGGPGRLAYTPSAPFSVVSESGTPISNAIVAISYPNDNTQVGPFITDGAGYLTVTGQRIGRTVTITAQQYDIHGALVRQGIVALAGGFTSGVNPVTVAINPT